MKKISWLGVDTGGTFTDFVYYDGHSLRVHKVLSTPSAPEQAILQGIHELGLDAGALRLVHGSTVATNAVLEGKGVKTVYISNRGFADVLQIGRQARRELYNLQPRPEPPLVRPEHCLEVDTRLSAQGELLQSLSERELARLRAELQQLAPRAVAINLLFSFLDDRQEKQIEACIPSGMFVSRSSAVLPEYKEYERGMTTCLNAYVGPLMQGYLQRLEQGLGGASVAVMQSAGGTVDAARAGHHAVHLLLSGPAGGLRGAQFVAGLAGHGQLLSFDMGGTSTDVALINREIGLTSEGHIGPYPVAVPMVDMHTIGAGGGSIARVDAGGLLLVGPGSAGADPGPACYGRGGTAATVTDANLVLGRLQADAFLGGSMALDRAAAERAVGAIGKALELDVQQAAEGIIRVANEHMARALRVMSVQRGIDPSAFTLVSFGGAGGLHVCALAESLGMDRALVPVQAGVLSALGMLVAAPSREQSRTLTRRLDDCDEPALQQALQMLRDEALADMASELRGRAADSHYSVDCRYLGQSFTLNLPWGSLAELAGRFHALHKQRYGHDLDIPVELVNIRVRLQAAEQPPQLQRRPALQAGEDAGRVGDVELYGLSQPVPVYQRQPLGQGQLIDGPALVLEQVSTTYVQAGWRCEVDAWGNLLLIRQARES
jgi:N-methylhydantoinase A